MPYVLFADETKQTVVGWFAGPQDPDHWPLVEDVDETDPRYIAYATPLATLPGALAAQTAVLTRAAAEQIEVGFVSSALGAPYTYPLDLTSQSNMQAAVIRANMPSPPASISYMCADATGVWARRPHSPAQLVQAALDGMTYIEAILAKKDALVAQINAATTTGAVLGTTWAYP